MNVVKLFIMPAVSISSAFTFLVMIDKVTMLVFNFDNIL
jgi:hypothetical protein